MGIRRIDIISIPVSDQKVAKSFYTDMLGFKIIIDSSMGPNQRWVQMGLPGAETSVTLVNWFETMLAGSLQGMVLDTTDIDTDRKELVGKGLEISEIQDAPWGRFATFSDPDGNGWVLKQAPI